MRFPTLVPMFLSAAIALPAVAQAEDVPPQVLAAPAKGEAVRTVHLKNVPSDVMLFLIDPARHKEPQFLSIRRSTTSFLAPPAKPELPTGVVVPALPAGVSVLVRPGDEHNLLIWGAPTALDAWEKAIDSLDKPLRQVEVETQMVTLTPKGLDMMALPKDGDGPHLLSGNFQQKLREALQAEQAVLNTAPRVTAFSGMKADLISTNVTPVASQEPPAISYSLSSIGMSVRPVLREDDSIDMEAAGGFARSVQADSTPRATLTPSFNADWRAQDGRTYLFYARPGADNQAPDAQGRTLAFFITARVIHRAPAPEVAK